MSTHRSSGSAVDPCPACEHLRGWRTGQGPEGLVERIHRMLEEVDRGVCTEEVELDGDRAEATRWTSFPQAEITADLMMRDGHGLRSQVVLRCARCGTRFTQSWVWERGYERWVVEEPG